MRSVMLTKFGVFGLATVLAFTAAGFWVWQTRYAISGSQGNHLEVRQAHKRATSGEIVLVDVRRPSEWRTSGVPASGHAITMHQSNRTFLRKLLAATGGDKSKPLALICATGGRTTWLQAQLRKAGFTSLFNVTEGMKGSRFGAGWLKKGLPVRKWTRAGASR